MSTINYQSIMQAIDEVLASPEFRVLIGRAILKKIGETMPAIVDESEATKETLVMPNGFDLYSAHALAFRFQSSLSRRPAADEDIYTLTAHFEDALKDGIQGQYIYESLRARGRSAEKLWTFLDRVRAEIKETKGRADAYYEKLKLKTNELIAERGL